MLATVRGFRRWGPGRRTSSTPFDQLWKPRRCLPGNFMDHSGRFSVAVTAVVRASTQPCSVNSGKNMTICALGARAAAMQRSRRTFAKKAKGVFVKPHPDMEAVFFNAICGSSS